jgi:hypothetical protein
MSLLTIQRWGNLNPLKMDNQRKSMDNFPEGVNVLFITRKIIEIYYFVNVFITFN